jgi:signal transduction histidine kinase
VRRIGHPPRGAGLLGAVGRSPHPIRIPEIGDDPRSVGFPAGHPVLHDLLAVPIPIRGTVYGSLYLSGAPRGAFSEEDEQLLRSLASTAGFAVDNAHLYRAVRRGQQWAAASTEIRTLLINGEEQAAFPRITLRVHEITEATSTFLLLVDEDDREQVTVVAVRGEDPNSVAGTTRPLSRSLAEHVIRTGEPQQLGEQELDARADPELGPFGRLLILPLTTSRATMGALLVARPPGAAVFTGAELTAATDFAGRAAVALELRHGREQGSALQLLADRGRIARDLHEQVIQQLFSTGMQLQSVLDTLPPGRTAARMDAAVAGLDDTIDQIRRIVFTLQSAGNATGSLPTRARLFELIARKRDALSIEPTLTVTGPLDAAVGGELADDLLAVVSEGITNAVRHAAAQAVDVTLTVAHEVTVRIANEGPPVPAAGRRSGIRNLQERAARRQGTLTLESAGGRTVLTWCVPVGRR